VSSFDLSTFDIVADFLTIKFNETTREQFFVVEHDLCNRNEPNMINSFIIVDKFCSYLEMAIDEVLREQHDTVAHLRPVD
jgi:hypothetical protein